MEVKVPAGKYILAVSGGVDSMVLLDLLANKEGVDIVVAHFNHGIRPDAGKDEALVEEKTKQLGLAYEAGYGRLGKGSSEEAARDARYHFLNEVLKKHKAKAIITAHHQDDLIETAILNLLRGTGRRGLVAISANLKIIRPLLPYKKKDIVNYAKEHRLVWRDDVSNQDEVYLRNYIRKNIVSNLTPGQREEIIKNIDKVAKIESILAPAIARLAKLVCIDQQINRQLFNSLPADLGNELIVYWLRQLKAPEFDRKAVNRLNVMLRTSRPGTRHPVKKDLTLVIDKKTARFTHTL